MRELTLRRMPGNVPYLRSASLLAVSTTIRLNGPSALQPGRDKLPRTSPKTCIGTPAAARSREGLSPDKRTDPTVVPPRVFRPPDSEMA